MRHLCRRYKVCLCTSFYINFSFSCHIGSVSWNPLLDRVVLEFLFLADDIFPPLQCHIPDLVGNVFLVFHQDRISQYLAMAGSRVQLDSTYRVGVFNPWLVQLILPSAPGVPQFQQIHKEFELQLLLLPLSKIGSIESRF